MASDVLDLSSYRDEYATEDVSDVSTAESEPNVDYDVDDIISQWPVHNARAQCETRYLTKWSDYELHRCTWEPAESFLDETALDAWEKKRASMTIAAWEDYCVKNARAFERAKMLAEGSRNKRQEKRRKKRMRSRRTSDSKSDGDATHLRRLEARSGEVRSKNTTSRDRRPSRAPRNPSMKPSRKSADSLDQKPRPVATWSPWALNGNDPRGAVILEASFDLDDGNEDINSTVYLLPEREIILDFIGKVHRIKESTLFGQRAVSNLINMVPSEPSQLNEELVSILIYMLEAEYNFREEFLRKIQRLIQDRLSLASVRVPD